MKHKIIQSLYYYYWLIRTWHLRKDFPKYKIMSIEETIDQIVNHKKSISRLGDADFLLLMEIRDVSYHRLHPVLSHKLREVLKAENENFLVAITDALVYRSYMNRGSRAHWIGFVNKYGKILSKYIPTNKIYGNTHMTRIYIDSLNEKKANVYFEKLKKIWDNKNIVIVEGEFSRLGVGNDLFDNASNIKRIIAPSRDAFFKYEEIISYLKTFPKDTQFLFALGPTASVMCYELSKEGYWAIDIGNVDMEYMWFKAKAKRKISIRGRLHVETDNSEPLDLLPSDKKKYEESIIYKIL